MINETDRRFKNLISTAQLVKKIAQHGYEGIYTEQAIYMLLKKYGVTAKTSRGGKSYFNKKNACECIDRHIFELKELAERLEAQNNSQQDEPEWNVGYGREDMSVASREQLANDGVFGADENELYRTNESKKIIRISEDKIRLFDIKVKKKLNITEQQYDRLFEDVFASKRTGKNKLQLTYNKRQSSDRTRNMGQLNPFDVVNTGKMDQNNEDTFIVPLKGGIESYNITSIRGTEVMHYFKNKWAKMNLDLDGDGVKEEYELWMSDPESKAFFEQFYNKVNIVINYAIRKMGAIEDFRGISIYPVPSSSNFNETMAKALSGRVKFANLPVIAINSAMFKKSQETIKADEDFMNKNSSYFNDRMFADGKDNISHRDYVYNTVARINQIGKIKELVDKYNDVYWNRLYMYYMTNKAKGGITFERSLAERYKEVSDILDEIERETHYSGGRINNSYEKMKGTKNPSEIRNTKDVWMIVKPYFRGTGQKPIQMRRLQVDDFQIKSLSNDTRMGMMDYFGTNDEITQKELEKTRGTVFVIFDDNISGGATLSDICYQAKKLGIKYIIPITFGQMSTKYTLGQGKVVNKPKNGAFVN